MLKSKRTLLIITIVFVSFPLLAIFGFLVLEHSVLSGLKREMERGIKEVSEYILVEYEDMEVERFSFFVKLKNVRLSKPSLPGNITIDSVKVRDFASLGFKAIPTTVIFEAIQFGNGDVFGKIKSLKIKYSFKELPAATDIAEDWLTFLRNLKRGEVALEDLTYKDRERQVTVGSLATAYVTTSENGREFELKGNSLKYQGEGMTLTSEALGFTAAVDAQNVLRHLRHRVDQVSFTPPAEASSDYMGFPQLRALGYDRLLLDGDFHYDYDPGGRNLNLGGRLTGRDMGRLQADLRLADCERLPLSLPPGPGRLPESWGQWAEGLKEAVFLSFTMAYEDLGLASRLIKAGAQAQGQSSEVYVRQLVNSLNTALVLLPLPPKLKEQLGAIKSFLKEPRGIQLTITAISPLRLRELQVEGLAGLLEVLSRAEVRIIAR